MVLHPSIETIDHRPPDFSSALIRSGIADLIGSAVDMETIEERIAEDSRLSQSITALSGSVRQWIVSALDEADERRVLRLRDGRRAVLGSRIAQGFFGEVRRVAVEGETQIFAGKFLREQHRSNAQARARMRTEADILRTCAIPGVPALLTSDDGEMPYLLLEEIEGVTLRDLLRISPLLALPARDRIARELTETLARVHAAGITHGDIKPENTMIGRSATNADLRTWIVDFGLSRRENTTRVTCEDATMGTRGFLDPAIIGAAKDRGPASDMYALGATLFELSVGKPLFCADDVRDPLQMTRERHDALVERALATLTDKKLLSLLASLLQFDGNARPTAAHVLRMLNPADSGKWQAGDDDLRCPLTVSRILTRETHRVPMRTIGIVSVSAGVLLSIAALLTYSHEDRAVYPVPVKSPVTQPDVEPRLTVEGNLLTIRLRDRTLTIDRQASDKLTLAGKAPSLHAYRSIVDDQEIWQFCDSEIGTIFDSPSLSCMADLRGKITIFSESNDVASEPTAKILLGKFLKSRRAFADISSGDQAMLLRANTRMFELQKAAGASAASRKRP